MTGGLREHDNDGDDGSCAECRARIAAGPCAACEALICGDCGVFSSDPSGKHVICLSCARLIADVNAKPLQRRPLSVKMIAVGVAIAFGTVALLSLLR